MKYLILLGSFFLFAMNTMAQDSYWASSSSVILSFSNASIEDPNNPGERILTADAPRFTIWYNGNVYYNYHINNHLGFYTGFGVNNIGFITNEKASVSASEPDFNTDVKWKRRAYALTIPLALKIGNMDNFYVYGGGQYDFLFHYKEKEFLSTGKRKMTKWFSQRVNMHLPSVFFGIAFSGGVSLQFTYSLNDFMNQDFSYTDGNGITTRPYQGMDSQIMYFSFFVNRDFGELTKSTTTTKKIAVL